jgi:hypothetical protein
MAAATGLARRSGIRHQQQDDALAPLGPPDGARLGAQQSPHGLDFAVVHRRSLEQPRMPRETKLSTT